MRLYQSKPMTIEAVQWTGDNFMEVADLASDKVRRSNVPDSSASDHLGGDLQLLAGKNGESGWLPVPVGNWIARKPEDPSDLWPIEPDHFAAKYALADG